MDEYYEGSVRNKNCYICGNPMDPKTTNIKEVTLDRRPRKVHSSCLKEYEKARRELQKIWEGAT